MNTNHLIAILVGILVLWFTDMMPFYPTSNPLIPMTFPDHILLTLNNDGPASAVLTGVRETFQSRYALC